MPSVRVKRHDYSVIQPEQRPRSFSIFNWPLSAPPDVSRPPQSAPPDPAIDAGPSSSPYNTQPQQRPRAASKVHDHCMRLSLRPSHAELNDGFLARPSSRGSSRQPMTTSQPELITLEGESADIIVRSDAERSRIGSAFSLPHSHEFAIQDGIHHHDDIVEHLDVIDPQVATVSNLTNAANSILIPPLTWYSRKPVVVLGEPRVKDHEEASIYEDALDRHVDDVLRRRAKFRRTLTGIWSFLKTPMGIITAIYGFLVVFWGAAIVIFLAKIINLHNANTQGFWVEVSSQVENGLFTVTGVGLIPSRILDTYRISKIWYYKRRTRKLRKRAGLPQLFDEDDLPDPEYDPNYVHVLTEEEEKDLHRQQVKFHHSQTWYRAHGTETHRAFPINIALLICCLNDGNSIFQVILCATMWSLNRFQRPAWSTGTLIPASFLCGIFSAVFIARGSAITKRTAKVEEALRAALAEYQSKLEPPTIDQSVTRYQRPASPNITQNAELKSISSQGFAFKKARARPAVTKESFEQEKTAFIDDPDEDVVIDEHMTVPASADERS